MIEASGAFLTGFFVPLTIALFAKFSASDLERSLKGPLQFIAILLTVVSAIMVVGLVNGNVREAETIDELKEIFFAGVGMFGGYILLISLIRNSK